jgi:hypothetical protein
MAQVLRTLRAEEANLRHALELARAARLWNAAAACLQGLQTLYERTGRDGEWARLVHTITPDFTDPATGGPLPGREDYWSIITSYRVGLAMDARDWPAATALHETVTAWDRDRAAGELPTAALPCPHPRSRPRRPRPHPLRAARSWLPAALPGCPGAVPADRRPLRRGRAHLQHRQRLPGRARAA